MSARIVTVMLFGLIGAAILVSLGVWQLQRLGWKQTVLAEIEARIDAVPVAVPDQPDAEADRYLPVAAIGEFVGAPARVLVSVQGSGPGYRLIHGFEVGDRRIMVDRGFLADAVALPDAPSGEVEVTGNLHWPDEIDGFTPDADLARNIWYARDVEALADYLEAEPIFLVLREMSATDGPVTPLPVTIEGIPNNHLGYAIQWFGLALVWLGMTAFLTWRITRRSV